MIAVDTGQRATGEGQRLTQTALVRPAIMALNTHDRELLTASLESEQVWHADLTCNGLSGLRAKPSVQLQ